MNHHKPAHGEQVLQALLFQLHFLFQGILSYLLAPHQISHRSAANRCVGLRFWISACGCTCVFRGLFCIHLLTHCTCFEAFLLRPFATGAAHPLPVTFDNVKNHNDWIHAFIWSCQWYFNNVKFMRLFEVQQLFNFHWPAQQLNPWGPSAHVKQSEK